MISMVGGLNTGGVKILSIIEPHGDIYFAKILIEKSVFMNFKSVGDVAIMCLTLTYWVIFV